LVRACDEGWQEFAAAVLDEAFSGTKSWDRAVLVRRLGEALQHVAGEYLHEAYEAAASPAERPEGARG